MLWCPACLRLPVPDPVQTSSPDRPSGSCPCGLLSVSPRGHFGSIPGPDVWRLGRPGTGSSMVAEVHRWAPFLGNPRTSLFRDGGELRDPWTSWPADRSLVSRAIHEVLLAEVRKVMGS